MMLGPISRTDSRSDSSNPRTIAVMPTMDVMPMTTPSTVSADRSMLLRIVSSAITITSVTRLALIASASYSVAAGASSFLPQRLDRVEARGARRRIEAEEQADECRDADAKGNRPELNRRGHWR